MIEIRNLVFEYPGARALHGVNLTIERQAIAALVGPNGAGKTTLLRCLAALETPYEGSVRIDGLDTGEAPRAIHARLGYLPDFYGLYDALSVRRCLHYAARAHGIAASDAREAAARAAARVGLSDRLEQLAGALSRGLRQRLAIGQALVHQPAVLLLDEPAAGLDPQARRDLSQLLLSLRDGGMTLVVSSHILAELEDYSTQMIVIDQGRVAGGGAVALGGAARLRITLAVPAPALKDVLARDRTITIIEADDNHAVITYPGGDDARAALLAALVRRGLPICGFAEDTRALEEVYFERVKQ